jgi:hypothetical protein
LEKDIDHAKRDGDKTKDNVKLAMITAWYIKWIKLFATYLVQHRSVAAGTLLAEVTRDND